MIVLGVIYSIATAFSFLLDVDVNTFLIPPDHFSFSCFAKIILMNVPDKVINEKYYGKTDTNKSQFT